MMKGIIILIITICSSGVYSQEDRSGLPDLIFDLNIGSRLGGAKSDSARIPTGFHFDVGMGYMFNNVFGIKADFGYNTFKTFELSNYNAPDKSYLMRGSIQGIFNVTEYFQFYEKDFGFNFHAGFGLSTIVNKTWKESQTDITDPYLSGNDDMINIIFGFTPRYHISNHFSLNFDLVFNLLFLQSKTIDIYNWVEPNDMTSYTTASLGITYRIIDINKRRQRIVKSKTKEGTKEGIKEGIKED